ncbi:MAG: hypothetical protein IJB89_00435 [Akkermansia sp.]|nr:hypothetical protein [Akkermansia sp.]
MKELKIRAHGLGAILLLWLLLPAPAAAGGSLRAVEVPGTALPSFLVLTQGESEAFSQESEVDYLFWSGEDEISATVQQARLKHLSIGWGDAETPELQALLSRVGKAYGDSLDWLTADTPIPNAVLVQATEPLDAQQQWSLQATAAEHEPIRSGILISGYTTQDNLQSFLMPAYTLPESPDEVLHPGVQFRINTPLEETAESLFRKLRFSMNGQQAQLSASGDFHELFSDGQRIRICPDSSANKLEPAPLTVPLQDKGKALLCPSDGCSGLTIRLSGGWGKKLTVTLPAGLLTTQGRRIEKEHTVSIILRIPPPQIVSSFPQYLTPNHLSFDLLGCRSIELTAYRIPAPLLNTGTEVIAEQHLTDLSPSGQSIRMDFPGEKPEYRVQHYRADWKQLTADDAEPGHFLLRLDMAGAQDSDRHTQWLRVDASELLTDIRYTPCPHVVITSGRNGDFINTGNIQLLRNGEILYSAPFRQSPVILPTGAEYAGANELRVLCGRDISSCSLNLGNHDNAAENSAHNSFLLTDRETCRAGETIHFHGLVKDLSDAPSSLNLRAEWSDGQERILSVRQLQTSQNGFFSEHFRLSKEVATTSSLLRLRLLNGDDSICCQYIRVVPPEAHSANNSALPRVDFLPIIRSGRRLTLMDGSERAYSEEAQLRLEAYGNIRSVRHVPCGLRLESHEEAILWQEELRIPAHCNGGIDLNPILDRHLAEQDKVTHYRIVFRGHNGKTVSQNISRHALDKREEESLYFAEAEVRHHRLRLLLPKPVEQDSAAQILLFCRQQARMLPLRLKQGCREVEIPLLAEEFGHLEYRLIIPNPKGGWPQHEEGYVTVPDPKKQLTIHLCTGDRLQQDISGHVVSQDGRPASAHLLLVRLPGRDSAHASIISQQFHESFFPCTRQHMTDIGIAFPSDGVGNTERTRSIWLNATQIEGFLFGKYRRHSGPGKWEQRADSGISDFSSSDGGNETDEPSFYLHRENERETPLLIAETQTDENGNFRTTLPLPADGNDSLLLILAIGADGQSNGSAAFYSGLEPAIQR